MNRYKITYYDTSSQEAKTFSTFAESEDAAVEHWYDWKGEHNLVAMIENIERI